MYVARLPVREIEFWMEANPECLFNRKTLRDP
jgi:hypothetical protein